VQQVFGIHSFQAPDGAPVRRTARFRLGLRDNTLTALAEDHPPAGATVAVTSDAAALRVVSLPFSDPRKAAQVAPFEVEGQVPYDIDEAVVGQEAVATSREGVRLLVAVAPRTHVAGLIEAQEGDAPQVILPEAYALYAFARRLALPAEGATLVVDLRPGRLLMVAVSGGRWLGGRLRGLNWDPGAPCPGRRARNWSRPWPRPWVWTRCPWRRCSGASPRWPGTTRPPCRCTPWPSGRGSRPWTGAAA